MSNERSAYDAAVLSAGTSHNAIYHAVIQQLQSILSSSDQQSQKLSLLDFGAGKCLFLRELLQHTFPLQLQACDILESPEDLPGEIQYHRINLEEGLGNLSDSTFDIVSCIEVIEHLENPRDCFRQLSQLVRDNGYLILTTPNQESLRSYASLIVHGHFNAFRENSYPAHITALLRLDLTRLCKESGFSAPQFFYTNHGYLPALTFTTWQKVSLQILKGRLFSDNVGMIARRLSEESS